MPAWRSGFAPASFGASIDEASSRLRMELDSSPVEIDELHRRVDRMRMEEAYLAESIEEEGGADSASVDRAAVERLERG